MKIGEDFVGVSLVYFCHDGQGNFIMAKRSRQARDEQGRWDIGAGALEWGMTVDDNLRKEIMEEYSTPVLGHEFLGYRDVRRSEADWQSHWIALDFKVLVDRTQVKIGEPHKFDELDWFTLETV